MYGTLALSHRALDDLIDAAGAESVDELRRLARPIEGLRVLNLSTSGFGTGNSELLNSSVPLMVDLGLDVQWQVVRASEEDAAVAKAMYQALGGIHVTWTKEMTDAWLRYAAMNADLLSEPFDVVIVHDPQPLAIRTFVPADHAAKWVMHSHLDLSSAQEEVWLLVRGHVERYDRAIFSSPKFTRSDISVPVDIIEPAIDPNSARNMPLPDEVVCSTLEHYGIDPQRPIVCQVSPCDGESDLIGAVEAWAAAAKHHPGLQLAIVLTTTPQDSQGRACYDDLARRTHDEPDAHVIAARETGNVELNVFQRAAAVVMQKGLRKGFGLWVSDALWKERPCVVAPVGGLVEQVTDGETGLIAASTDEFASAISRLLSDPALSAKLGENGRRHVRERFLITRYLRDYLLILNDLHRNA